MTRSHRNEDRGGERRWTFNGVEYPTRKLMCAARREEYVRLLDEEGMNFTQAAHAVEVSKRTGKVWRNGRTRATGRNEKASMDWYRSTMDKPKRIHALPQSGGAHPDRRPAAPGRFDPRHRAPAGTRPRSSATGIPSPAITSPTGPSRRQLTGSNAPNCARRPTARRCGRRYWPGCAGIGARSRYPAD